MSSRSSKRDRQRQNRMGARAQQLEAAKQAKRRRNFIRTGVLLTLLVVLIVVGALVAGGGDDETDVSATSNKDKKNSSTTTTTAAFPAIDISNVTCDERKPDATPAKKTYSAPPEMKIDPAKKYTATVDTSCGKIVLELAAKDAPKTVNNFVFLAREGYYDGLTWHRVVKDFVIQGGDPEGTGRGNPGYEFEDELPKDKHYGAGALAMANSGPNTNGSQFFIVTGPNGPKILDQSPNYSRFGKVTEGLEVAKKLESFAQPDDPNDKPSRTLYMFKVEITESAG